VRGGKSPSLSEGATCYLGRGGSSHISANFRLDARKGKQQEEEQKEKSTKASGIAYLKR
jgi:hypothetical protein